MSFRMSPEILEMEFPEINGITLSKKPDKPPETW